MSTSNKQFFENGFKVGKNWLLKKGPFAEAGQKILDAAAYIRAGLDDQIASERSGLPLEAVEKLRKLLESADAVVTH
ncbi:MAG: hypothetical protein K0R48_575 [Gammaproteobacteria bacterium]|jgi:hypothetical protein|nr:hypothetical protein [Gammaproteobacteria bacterium]